MNDKNFDQFSAMEIDKKLNETEHKYVKNIVPQPNNYGFKERQETLKLIPKYIAYMEYMLDALIVLPRVEKFNIGNDFKNNMYETFENIMYLEKIENKSKMYYLNKIDSGINIQRVYLRIMAKHKWISIEKFNVIMLQQLSEIGRIIGGLVKYYSKNKT